MDFATREHIRRQIDSAARKKEGLPQRKVTRTVQKPFGFKGKRWSDGDIVAAIQACSTELEVPRPTLAQYRNWRDLDPTSRPNPQTVQARLGKDGVRLA